MSLQNSYSQSTNPDILSSSVQPLPAPGPKPSEPNHTDPRNRARSGPDRVKTCAGLHGPGICLFEPLRGSQVPEPKRSDTTLAALVSGAGRMGWKLGSGLPGSVPPLGLAADTAPAVHGRAATPSQHDVPARGPVLDSDLIRGLGPRQVHVPRRGPDQAPEKFHHTLEPTAAVAPHRGPSWVGM
jgi:hypothetical protein